VRGNEILARAEDAVLVMAAEFQCVFVDSRSDEDAGPLAPQLTVLVARVAYRLYRALE
jgi:hypothetical protein